MSEVSTAPVKTFSIGFAHREHNELGLARLVAERFSTEHCELIVEPETVDVLPDLVGLFWTSRLRIRRRSRRIMSPRWLSSSLRSRFQVMEAMSFLSATRFSRA